jgi:uncharacterized protein (DUF952 family)
MALLLHITTRNAWEQARREGAYRAASLASQGFIHCSTREQVIDVANGIFRGQRDLVLLCIDGGRLSAEVRYENLEGGTRLFPHIYGAVNLEAVRTVEDFIPADDGLFRLPDALGGEGHAEPGQA